MPNDLDISVSSGSGDPGFVNVVSPDGEIGSLPREAAQQVLSSGEYKLADPNEVSKQFEKDQLTDKYGSALQQGAAFLEEAGRIGTFGLSTAIEQQLQVPSEEILGRQKVLEEEHPAAQLGAGLAGLVGSSVLFPGGGAAGIMGAAEGAAARLAGLTGKGLMTGIGRGAVKGAVGASMVSGGDQLHKMIAEDPKQTLESAAVNITGSGVLGALFGAPFGGVGALWQASKDAKIGGILGAIKNDLDDALSPPGGGASAPPVWDVEQGKWVPGRSGIGPIMETVLSKAGGVAKEDIRAYMANAEAVRAAPGFDDVYAHTLKNLSDIMADLEAKKTTLAGVKEAHDRAYNEALQSFKQINRDAKVASQKSVDQANQAWEDASRQLEIGPFQVATAQSKTIIDSLKKIKEDTRAGSDHAEEALNEHGSLISLRPLYDEFEKEIAEIRKQPSGALTSKQIKALESVMESEKNLYGEDATGPDVKNIIRGLNKLSGFDRGLRVESAGLESTFNWLRGFISNQLKTEVPEYGERMKAVALKSDLYDQLVRLGYGNDINAQKKIYALKGEIQYHTEMPLLRDLERESGAEFLHLIEDYANKNKIKARAESIPEYERLQRINAAHEAFKDPYTRDYFEKVMADSATAEKIAAAEAELAVAAKEKAKLGGMTERSLESKLKAVRDKKSIFDKKVLQQFPFLNGMSIPDVLELIRISDAFEKKASGGGFARKIAGGIAGTMMGGGAGGIGGYAAGDFATENGPRLVREILDKYMHHFGNLHEEAGSSKKATETALMMALQSDQPHSGKGFKAAADFIQNVIKGMTKVKDAATNVLENGGRIVPHMIMDKRERDKFQEKLNHIEQNPSALLESGGHIPHYMENQAAPIGMLAARMSNYLNSIKPREQKSGILDPALAPTDAKKMEYERAMDIANQPLVVFQKIKDSTITVQDVGHLKAIYPSLYKSMYQSMYEAIIESKNEGKTIPYKTRLSLSVFLGEPLDSSMLPQSILAAQPKPEQRQQEAQAKGRGSMKNIGKMAEGVATPGQARAMDRSNG